MADVFACPDCGAPLQPDGAATTVRCPYCATVVVVPAALRSPGGAPAGSGTTPAFVVEFPAYPPAPRPAPAVASRRGGCGCALLLLLLIGLGVGLPLYLAEDGGSPTLLARPASPTRRPTPGPTATPLPGFADVVLTIDGTAAGPGQFKDAGALAIDGSGTIYVTDAKPGRVLRFDAQGHFLNSWPAGQDYPATLAADHAGNVYTLITDSIRKYAGATGTLLDTLRFHDTDFGFFGFNDVAVLADGTLLASLGNTTNLIHLDAQGKEIARLPHVLEGHSTQSDDNLRPALDAQGNIYVLGVQSSAVYKLAADGRFLSQISGQGDAPGLLDTPHALAVDRQGRLYVSDSNGIEVFDAAGRYLGTIKTNGYVASLAVDGQDQVVAAVRNHVVAYRLNARATPPPVVGAPPSPTPVRPTATPLPSLGSTVTFEGWVISVARAEVHPTLLLKSQDTTLKADGHFYLLWIDVRNQQASTHRLSDDFRWVLTDKSDEKYYDLTADNPDDLGQFLHQEGRDLLTSPVNPHALAHPLLIFGVPDGVQPTLLLIQSTVGGAEVRFALPAK